MKLLWEAPLLLPHHLPLPGATRLKCNSTTWWIKLHVSHEGVSKYLLCPARLLHLGHCLCLYPFLSVCFPSFSAPFFFLFVFFRSLRCLRSFVWLPFYSVQSCLWALFDTQCLEWVIFSASAAGGWCSLLQAAEAVPQQCIFVGWLIISETLLVSNN